MGISEDRSELFALWEKRLRGWEVYDVPVKLEPSFAWCPKDLAYQSKPVSDDGRHATLLSGVAEWFKGKSANKEIQSDLVVFDYDQHTPNPLEDDEQRNLIELQLVLPEDTKTQQSLMGYLFTALKFSYGALSFEVIGNETEIVILLVCDERDADHVEQQLVAHHPECVVDRSTDYLEQQWDNQQEQLVVEFGLSEQVMRPLAMNTGGYDVLTSLAAALSSLQKDEVVGLQILFTPTQQPWGDAMLDAVTNADGSAFFADASDVLPLTKQKITSPMVACVIRVFSNSDSEIRNQTIVRQLGGSLMQLEAPGSNHLIPLENDGHNEFMQAQSIVSRSTYRQAMLLNMAELTTLAHMPDASVRVPKLKRLTKKTKRAPNETLGHDLALGKNLHRGKEQTVTIPEKLRMRHMYVIGASGTGKSTLFINMIRQDIEQDNGVAVIDPHGDLIDKVLDFIPEERIEDTILFDPSDAQYPVAFNILDAHSELEKNLLASDLVGIFRRLSTTWGDQMNSVLANGIIAILESTEGGTLSTLRRFLVDRDFRNDYLKTVQDSEIRFYWEKEFPLLSGKPQGPVLTRLDTFLRPKLIRNMVSQKENKIDFAKIMQNKQIFLAKLSQGEIGEENSYLLGSLILSKLNQMAYARQSLAEGERIPFYTYVDEFHNLISRSMESILSGTRKYGLGFILAHQELRQLEGKDADVAASVLSNPATRICFRLGDKDAKRLQPGFSGFHQTDLLSLGIGEAIARVERADFDFNLATPMLPEIDRQKANSRKEKLIAHSRQQYANTLTEEDDSTDEDENDDATHQNEHLSGKGGLNHKQLQKQIKELGEAAGFRSLIERPIYDAENKLVGHVDVALEREGLRIAIEIAMTLNVEHEIVNIKKCLAAGFDQVWSVSDDLGFFEHLKAADDWPDRTEIKCVLVSSIEAEIEALKLNKGTTKGYQVRITKSED